MTDDRSLSGHASPDPPSNAASTPAPALEVDTVSVSYGPVSVLEDVSFTIESGEVVGVVGPNGAGKSTLLRTISGALTPDTGSVTVAGIDVHTLSSRASSQLVSVVPQDTTLSFSFDVETIVEMGRYPHRSRFSPPTDVDREHVDRALERTRTAQFADRPIDELSGGERQRVILARALAQDTPLLVLDEPTGSLDVNHQVETLDLVRSLSSDGRTVLAAIHDLDLAARFCDRVLVLTDGTIDAIGTPDAVLTRSTLETAFEANAAVTHDPVTGTPRVTAFPTKHDSLEAAAAVHVLGTGPTAVGVALRLEAAGVEVTVGPVTTGSTLAELAREHDFEAITVEPFTAIGEDTTAAVRSAVRTAEATVLANFTLSSGTEHLLETLAIAPTLVLVETQPFTDRNSVGPAGEHRYYDVLEQATVLEATPETIVETVCASVVGADARSRTHASERAGESDVEDTGENNAKRERERATSQRSDEEVVSREPTTD